MLKEERNTGGNQTLDILINILAEQSNTFPVNKYENKSNLNHGLIEKLKEWSHSISRFVVAGNSCNIYINSYSSVASETLIASEKILSKYLKVTSVNLCLNLNKELMLSDNFLASFLPWAGEYMIHQDFAVFSLLLNDIKAKSKSNLIQLSVSASQRKIFSPDNCKLIEDFYLNRLGIEVQLDINVDNQRDSATSIFNNLREESFYNFTREQYNQSIEEDLLAGSKKVIKKIDEHGDLISEVIEVKTIPGDKNAEDNESPTDTNSSKRNKSNSSQKDNKKIFYRRSPNHVYGRLDSRLELIKDLRTLDSESGRVSVYGKVAFYEEKLVSNNTRVLIKFAIHGESGALTCLLFLNDPAQAASFHDKVKDGVYVRADLDVSYDGKFTKDLQGFVRGIELAEGPEPRKDNAPVKRVELHMHTNLSERDGISRTRDLVNLADSFNMPAVAITDHGVVQAYPEAADQLAKLRAQGSQMKLIYGCEIYFMDDGDAVAYGFRDLDIDSRIVDVRIITTGDNVKTDRILACYALEFVRSANSSTFEAGNRFMTYFNPEIDLNPEMLSELNIKKEDIETAPKSLEAVSMLHDFIGDAAVSSEQGLDILGFLRYEAYRTPNYDDPRDKFNPTFIDIPSVKRIFAEEVSAILKEDFATAEELPEVYRSNYSSALTFIKVWEKHDFIPLRELNILAGQDSFAKVTEYKNKPYHGIILVQDALGLYNLYRLISESHVRYFKNRPRMPKSLIKYLRQGMFLGTSCEAGQALRRIRQIYIETEGDFEKSKEILKNDLNIQEKMAIYDYLEIQPLGNNLFMLDKPNNYVDSLEDIINLNKLVLYLAELCGKMVVATCDAHFLNKEDVIYREILQASAGFDTNENPTVLYLRTTEEMLKEFYYLDDDLAYEIVVTNTNKIAAQVSEDILPFPPSNYPPEIETAPQEVKSITWDRCNELYDGKDGIPEIITSRVERELSSIIDNGFSVMYYISHKLVKHTNDDGYIVGSRGSVGSSFVAYLCGITEVNPLPPHYVCHNCKYSEFTDPNAYGSGFDLPEKNCPECSELLFGEGQNIPFETFLGFNGDKEPDIDLNFSGEYQPFAHQFIIDMFGASHTFRAGTITSYAEKNAIGLVRNYAEKTDTFMTKAEAEKLALGLNGIKRSTGQHPGGVVVIPKDREIYDFTPIQYPANNTDAAMTTTHFDFNSMHDTILKLDILGHDDPQVLKVMSDISGLDIMSIPVPDKDVMRIFESSEVLGIPLGTTPDNCGTLGIPEMGTLMARDMIKETSPSSFFDLVQLMGLSHGTDVWQNNAQDLIRSGTCTLDEVIGCRDGIMTSLIAWGLDPFASFQIMEKVRKGKGLTPEHEAMMIENNVPEWYIKSCKKIKYMFPKAHAAAYVISALRIAWFKVHQPATYYAAFFSVRADEFDYALMNQPLEKITNMRASMRKNFHQLTDREQKIYYIIELVEEMMLRGISFAEIDIEEANARRFKVIDDKHIMPALNSINSISTTMANNIVEARSDGNGEFKSHKDLMTRSGLGQSAIKNLAENGILSHIPESAQITLFDMNKF